MRLKNWLFSTVQLVTICGLGWRPYLQRAADNKHLLHRDFMNLRPVDNQDLLIHITDLESKAAELNDLGVMVTETIDYLVSELCLMHSLLISNCGKSRWRNTTSSLPLCVAFQNVLLIWRPFGTISLTLIEQWKHCVLALLGKKEGSTTVKDNQMLGHWFWIQTMDPLTIPLFLLCLATIHVEEDTFVVEEASQEGTSVAWSIEILSLAHSAGKTAILDSNVELVLQIYTRKPSPAPFTENGPKMIGTQLIHPGRKSIFPSSLHVAWQLRIRRTFILILVQLGTWVVMNPC